MFRDLIPLLADRYHVIAPDHLGFGLSDAPGVAEFDYTFDALTDLTEELLAGLGVTRYAVYVQDYGAPIGWRLALRHPEAVAAIVTQNGNGYDEGFVEDFWRPVWAYHRDLRDSAVPVLAVWGKGDEIFGPEGAKAFATDAHDAEIHLLDGGHFLLESAVDEAAALIGDFLDRKVAA